MLNLNHNQKGFATFLIAILVLVVLLGISVSITVLILGRQRILRNVVESTQAYYVAEVGIEDALLRLSKKMNWSSPYTLSVDGGFATIEISDIIGGTRTITSQGDMNNRIRKVRVVHRVSSEKIAFYYGAQVGDGGIIMDEASTINGNVFSNGSIISGPNTQITGTVWVANEGNKIQGVDIGGDAYAHTCKDSIIAGTLTYVSGGSVTNCPAGEAIKERPNNIDAKDLPITEEQIQNWKNNALSGGIISGDYILSGTSIASLGPQKIEGNLITQDQTQLFITGTLWVTGDITIQNKSRVSLDRDTYGSLGGVIISDGIITLLNEGKALGSGEEGSYLLLISTAAIDPAITIQDTFETDILYAQNGWILIQDSADVREMTGYGIHLTNNAEIFYEIGLEDASFTSGPGGSWELASWKEIE